MELTFDALATIIKGWIVDAVAPVRADVDAMRDVLTLDIAQLRERVEALETPAETEAAEAVEEVLDGEAAPESEEQLEEAIETAVTAGEIDAEIDAASEQREERAEAEVAADVEPTTSHLLTRPIFGGD